ncbi:translation initiation factor [Hydrogenimonas sp.]
MARGIELDIDFADWGDGWEADNKKRKNESEVEVLPPSKHRLVFKKEKRRGKPVTLAGEFFLGKAEAKALLGRVKKRLGCGGAFKAGWLEIQGDRQMALREALASEGFGFKK